MSEQIVKAAKALCEKFIGKVEKGAPNETSNKYYI